MPRDALSDTSVAGGDEEWRCGAYEESSAEYIKPYPKIGSLSLNIVPHHEQSDTANLGSNKDIEMLLIRFLVPSKALVSPRCTVRETSFLGLDKGTEVLPQC